MAQDFNDALHALLHRRRARPRPLRAGDAAASTIVIHAAALKQVPAAEYNPFECIKTNILGAENVIQAALDNEVEKVIALSTDKAANPINLYGATKLASDKIFVAANNLAGGHRTRFAVVRYGNVVGSRGSVVPFFRKLLGAGREGAADHRPAHDAVLDHAAAGRRLRASRTSSACTAARSSCRRSPRSRITDLAEAMAPGLPHKIVGIRPGEKLHEIMCPRDDSHLTLEFADHYVIEPSISIGFTADYRDQRRLGETAKPVVEGFEYNSGSNPHFLVDRRDPSR